MNLIEAAITALKRSDRAVVGPYIEMEVGEKLENPSMFIGGGIQVADIECFRRDLLEAVGGEENIRSLVYEN